MDKGNFNKADNIQLETNNVNIRLDAWKFRDKVIKKSLIVQFKITVAIGI